LKNESTDSVDEKGHFQLIPSKKKLVHLQKSDKQLNKTLKSGESSQSSGLFIVGGLYQKLKEEHIHQKALQIQKQKEFDSSIKVVNEV
jgi:hypothetical protein